MSKVNTLELIQNTAPGKIAELDMVKEKFIKNYNLANRSENGDLMYHRQLVYFNQNIAASTQLQNADKFSLYACFITAAVKGYSFDPLDNEIYLVPRGGKACMQLQAGAHVRRLIQTQQSTGCEQAKLVFKGDIFEVEDGVVKRHIEKFESETIIAGYVKFNTAGGGFKYFIYRKSDFESWRKKSSNPNTIEKTASNGNKYLSESLWDNGVVGGENPEPAFLRTKIILHAAKEKCWFTGTTPIELEQFNVEIDVEDDNLPTPEHVVEPKTAIPEYAAFEEVPEGDKKTQEEPVDEEAF
jgi:recombinational DNA repair protein RecT